MDSSGLIFVALAIAWACYLIPKALRHTDQEKRTQTVDRFSHRMRVLARRGDTAAPAPAPASAAAESRPARQRSTAQPEPTTAQLAARRAAHRKATKRRRNVLAVILLGVAGTATAAGLGYLAWWYVAIPAAILVAWLVLCRVMVRGERRSLEPRPVVLPSDAGEVEDELVQPDEFAVSINDQGFDEVSEHAVTSVLADSAKGRDTGLWDPVPVTLPTYVDKEPAKRRKLATIDLDSTGVWSSGRSEADSKLARDADAAAATPDGADTNVRRASGQ